VGKETLFIYEFVQIFAQAYQTIRQTPQNITEEPLSLAITKKSPDPNLYSNMYLLHVLSTVTGVIFPKLNIFCPANQNGQLSHKTHVMYIFSNVTTCPY
jgi:hypothetical protein